MGFYLNPTNEAFRIAVEDDIYVDKTELIAYTNQVLGKNRRFLCVSRPRRFGKSMAANMLSAYYSRGNQSVSLFFGLNIAETDSYLQYLNQYNVIFLNMQQLLTGAGKAELLPEYIEQVVNQELFHAYPEYLGQNKMRLPDALMTVFEKEEREHTGFIFIIDEWDCIFRESRQNKNAQKKYLDFLQDLLKDRIYVKLAYMTGILPIKKYGTHSALNIFYEYSMTDPDILADYVGFTEAEVQALCQKHHKDFEEMQFWYDGYRFPDNCHIYNPKSVIDALQSKRFKSYWTNTETYEALKLYIDMNLDGLKDAVVQMLSGGKCHISTRKFQNDMTSFGSRDDVMTLLVHLGYLAYDAEKEEVSIPNQEVAGEFRNAVEGKEWGEVSRLLSESEKLLDSTLHMDAEAVAAALDRAHQENTSILMYNDENALSCVIAIAYYSARKEYVMLREFPSGKGVADLVFLPRKISASPALIVELKWNRSAKSAIQQIKEKNYIEKLADYRGDVLLVGINYDKVSKKHHCIIEKECI